MSRSRAILRLGPAIVTLLLGAACSSMLNSRESLNGSSIPFPHEFLDASERLIIVTIANDSAPAIRAGSTPRSYESAVTYAASSRALETAAALASDYELLEVRAWPIAALSVFCVVFEIPKTGARPDLLLRLSTDKRVKLAQPMQTFGTSSHRYNDPYVELQRGFTKIDVADAHHWSRGASVRVAVIDTGIDFSHPDLRGRVTSTRNFVDVDRVWFKRDRHGTEVAGVIAAVADNGEGIVGVAPEVELLAYKACWQLAADQDDARCNSFTLARALAAAMDEKAQVVNLSLTGPADPLLAALVAQGMRRGIVYVGAVAPGASRDSETTKGFPSGEPGVLAVDSVEEHVHNADALLAPGREILTLLPGGHYQFASGSSLAAAHVTGTVALLLAREQRLDANELQILLTRSSDPIVKLGGLGESINACVALATALGRGTCASTRNKPFMVGEAGQSY